MLYNFSDINDNFAICHCKWSSACGPSLIATLPYLDVNYGHYRCCRSEANVGDQALVGVLYILHVLQLYTFTKINSNFKIKG